MSRKRLNLGTRVIHTTSRKHSGIDGACMIISGTSCFRRILERHSTGYASDTAPKKLCSRPEILRPALLHLGPFDGRNHHRDHRSEQKRGVSQSVIGERISIFYVTFIFNRNTVLMSCSADHTGQTGSTRKFVLPRLQNRVKLATSMFPHLTLVASRQIELRSHGETS
jgi:hypothetical protein